MKILLIGPGKLKYMPYAHFYLDVIGGVNNEVHLAYWNRDEKSEDTSKFNAIHLHEFSLFMVNDEKLFTKVRYISRFARFCKKIIKKHNFDRLIILHTISGVMLTDLLFGEYSNRYILDYRDSTYERLGFFRRLVGGMVKHSMCTFVSSDAFRKYLPIECKEKIYTSHNLLLDSLSHREYTKVASDKIRIAFWGFIRHVDINKVLIDAISKDERFELHYYGREQKDALDLKDYTKAIGANNVYFHGEYVPEDRYKFVAQTDIIHNIYSGANENMAMAMGNKYYDSIIFRIPQVCQAESFMDQAASRANVGIGLNPMSDDFTESLYVYYKGLERNNFMEACDRELERVMKEYNFGIEVINEICNKS